VKGFTVEELRALTNETIDTQLGIIAESEDADVTFEPEDPDAHDEAAATDAEVKMAWTLGHIVVHVTASAEEAAFLAAELARGVPYREGRSRSEVHWTRVTTIEQCRERLEESRRMRLASLDLWPREPYLDNLQPLSERRAETVGRMNAVVRFVLGLRHDDSHLGHLREVVRQARVSRLG
jgi:hypothetical protein